MARPPVPGHDRRVLQTEPVHFGTPRALPDGTPAHIPPTRAWVYLIGPCKTQGTAPSSLGHTQPGLRMGRAMHTFFTFSVGHYSAFACCMNVTGPDRPAVHADIRARHLPKRARSGGPARSSLFCTPLHTRRSARGSMLVSFGFQRFRPFIVVLALVVGITACDSSGTSGSDDDDNNTNVAQSFNVTVTSISSSYPYSNRNNVGVAYAVDGDVGKVITLERGKTYEFTLGAGVSPSHPFYVGTTAEGGGGDEFRDNPAKKTTGTVTFSVPSSAPDSLFYVCDAHVYMGGKMEIADASGTRAE